MSEFIGWIFTPENRRVGIQGEREAVRVIKSVLREGNQLFTNVSVECDGKRSELDAVIVNEYGVFIIEVKNYSGRLIGGEDDFEWEKYKTTAAGNTYSKIVKNPIKQVKRQIFILARFLDCHGIKVWVDGYVNLLERNSPVISNYILTSTFDIDCAIHTEGKKKLTPLEVNKIVELLLV
ncbi:MAG: NERD domain-containing protein [Eubacterium sp.]|nr:NERD domain-containing protein [Eubacterium sp.]